MKKRPCDCGCGVLIKNGRSDRRYVDSTCRMKAKRFRDRDAVRVEDNRPLGKLVALRDGVNSVSAWKADGSSLKLVDHRDGEPASSGHLPERKAKRKTTAVEVS